jgi:hypothetical protein
MASVTAKERVTWLAGFTRSPERAVLALILIFLVVRLVLAATLGLGVDECYAIGVSHDLNLSYFDYPPLTYWIIHFFLPLLGDGRAIRLPFVVMFAGTSWMLYLLTRRLFGAAAGVWAVLALNLSMFLTIAGTSAVSDAPLIFCLMAAALTIAKGLFPDRQPPSPWRTWILAGLWIGLAALTKYHAVLFVAGLFIYLVSVPSRRRILQHPAPWAGAVVALVIFSPVIIWNAEHHWVSFIYQGGRALSSGSFPKLEQFLVYLGAEILWLAPWIFPPMVVATYQALRHGRSDDRSWYCLCLGTPTILLFTLIPLWGNFGLPHWPMPGWLMLYPVLGDCLARENLVRARPRIWAVVSPALLLLVLLVAVGDGITGYSRVLFPTVFAKGDPMLESYQWTPLRGELQRRGLLDKNGLFIISGSPIDIAKIDQALNDALPMQVFGEPKQYAFRYDPNSLVGRDALIIGVRERMHGVDRGLTPYFDSIEELPPFVFGRSGLPDIDLRILYGHVLKKPLPSPYERRPDQAGSRIGAASTEVTAAKT